MNLSHASWSTDAVCWYSRTQSPKWHMPSFPHAWSHTAPKHNLLEFLWIWTTMSKGSGAVGPQNKTFDSSVSCICRCAAFRIAVSSPHTHGFLASLLTPCHSMPFQNTGGGENGQIRKSNGHHGEIKQTREAPLDHRRDQPVCSAAAAQLCLGRANSALYVGCEG